MRVEFFLEDQDEMHFVGEFGAVPRIGETVARDAGGYFDYFEVLEVWYRGDTSGKFQACVSVRSDS